jgi:hypothetical protein
MMLYRWLPGIPHRQAQGAASLKEKPLYDAENALQELSERRSSR